MVETMKTEKTKRESGTGWGGGTTGKELAKDREQRSGWKL